MSPSRVAICLVALALVLGCGPKTRLEKLGADAVILAFGDSLTYGTGAAPSEAYPAVLEGSIGRKVVNAGVPGETTDQGRQRLPEVLDEVKPQLLILCHGGNDFLRRSGDAQAAENVRAMIRLAQDNGIPVVLIATPRPGLPPSVPEFYAQIAVDLKVPYEDAALRSVLIDNSLKSDMVHPNAKGYAQVAQAVKKVLERAGAI